MISQRKSQISKLAYQNQVNFRQQLQHTKENFKELEKQHRIDMESKIVIKKIKKDEDN